MANRRKKGRTFTDADSHASGVPRHSIIDASDWQTKATAHNLIKYQAFLRRKQKEYKYADAESFFESRTTKAKSHMSDHDLKLLEKLSKSEKKIGGSVGGGADGSSSPAATELKKAAIKARAEKARSKTRGDVAHDEDDEKDGCVHSV